MWTYSCRSQGSGTPKHGRDRTCSHVRSTGARRRKRGQVVGDPKVGQQRYERVQACDQDVGGSQVPVQDAQGVQVMQAGDHLAEQGKELDKGQASCALGSHKEAVQAPLLAELHHQPHLAVGCIRADAVHGQDVVMGVVLELLVQASLIVNRGLVRTVCAVELHGDGHTPPQHVVHVPKCPGAQGAFASRGQVPGWNDGEARGAGTTRGGGGRPWRGCGGCTCQCHCD
jgi:hypothetical protein